MMGAACQPGGSMIEGLLLFQFSEQCRSGKHEEDYLLASYGAYVVVQADDLDAGDLFDHRLHDGTSGFDELRANLVEEIPAAFGRVRIGQLLLGCGQHAAKTDDQKVAIDAF